MTVQSLDVGTPLPLLLTMVLTVEANDDDRLEVIDGQSGGELGGGSAIEESSLIITTSYHCQISKSQQCATMISLYIVRWSSY